MTSLPNPIKLFDSHLSIYDTQTNNVEGPMGTEELGALLHRTLAPLYLQDTSNSRVTDLRRTRHHPCPWTGSASWDGLRANTFSPVMVHCKAQGAWGLRLWVKGTGMGSRLDPYPPGPREWTCTPWMEDAVAWVQLLTMLHLSKDNRSQLIFRVDTQDRTARTGRPKAPEGPEGDRFQIRIS